MDQVNSTVHKNAPKLLVIGGPTAAGKSVLAMHIARELSCEIVNADSRQIYRHLAIGTNRPGGPELENVPHHLYGFVDPQDSFTAADFERKVTPLISQIIARSNLPVLVGGTGFYIKAALRGVWPVPPKNEELRNRLRRIAGRHHPLFLHKMLLRFDPVSAASIAPPDTYRLIRALEIYFQSGVRRSDLVRNQDERYNAFKLYIDIDRDRLRQKIEARTHAMFQQGWIEEVESLLEKFPDFEALPAAKSLGYHEIIQYLRKQISAEECKERIVRRTRQYAKRQLTWFRNQDAFQPVSPEVPLRKTLDSVLQWYRD